MPDNPRRKDTPLGYQPLQQLAYERIRSDILRGVYRPGESLSIRGLAASYGVSPIPVREAMRGLEAEGLVDFSPNRGATIRALSEADLHEILAMRLVLEPLALRRSMARLDAASVERLGALVAQMHPDRTDPAKWFEIHQEFHFRLYREAGLPRLYRTITGLWGLMAPYFGVYVATARNLRHAYAEHVELFKACRSGNATRAARLLEQHMTSSQRVVMEGLRDSGNVTGDDGLAEPPVGRIARSRPTRRG